MQTFTKNVLSLNWETKGKRKWRSISEQEIKGGKVFKTHLFPGQHDALIAYFETNGPGAYELDKEKDGDYWTLNAARKVGELQGSAASQAKSQPPPNGNGKGSAAPPAAGGVSAAAQVKASIATAAVDGASRVVSAMVESGMFKNDDVSAVNAALQAAVGDLREDALEWVKGMHQQNGNTEPPEGA